jgi:hypothetical protein
MVSLLSEQRRNANGTDRGRCCFFQNKGVMRMEPIRGGPALSVRFLTVAMWASITSVTSETKVVGYSTPVVE